MNSQFVTSNMPAQFWHCVAVCV